MTSEKQVTPFDFVKFDGAFFIGIAIDRSEGAIDITNQVGGTWCGHPIARGLLVPLPSHWQPDPDPLHDWYLSEYDPKRVSKFLVAAGLHHVFRPLEPADAPVYPNWTIDPCVLAEAWVPVRVRSAEELSKDAFRRGGDLLQGFAGERMILTYHNSD